MSAHVAAIALVLAWALVLFGPETARASDEDCSFKTRAAIVADLTQDATEGAAKTLGTGLLLIAARGAPGPVRIGSAILFAVEALGFTRTASQAAQMPLQGDPNQKMRVCRSEGAFASTFGFRSIDIVSTDADAADGFKNAIQRRFGTPSLLSPFGNSESGSTETDAAAGLGGSVHQNFGTSALLSRLHESPPNFSKSPDTPAVNPPTVDAPPVKMADLKWDDKAIDDVLTKLRSAPKPIFGSPTNQFELADLPPPAPPAPLPSFAAAPATVHVAGEVVDDATDGAVDQGFLYVSTTSLTAGLWQTAMISSDGKFSLDLPPGSYVASVSVPGYMNVRRNFTLAAGGPAQDLEVRLPHRSPYPCSFTVVNNTGYRITLYMGTTQGPIEMVEPRSFRQFTVTQAFNIGPQAEFTNAAPLVWAPIAADCEDSGIAYLDP
jgi:hypothetical protein